MNITLDQVASVYSGKQGHCCCGCAGKHTYASHLRDESSKSRGYPIRDEEVNDRIVKRMFNKFMKTPEIDISYLSETCYTIDTPTRVYILYLKGN